MKKIMSICLLFTMVTAQASWHTSDWLNALLVAGGTLAVGRVINNWNKPDRQPPQYYSYNPNTVYIQQPVYVTQPQQPSHEGYVYSAPVQVAPQYILPAPAPVSLDSPRVIYMSYDAQNGRNVFSGSYRDNEKVLIVPIDIFKFKERQGNNFWYRDGQNWGHQY